MRENDELLTVVGISNMTIHNGPGIRTLVLFKGCPLRCKWCSTPESWEYEQELVCNPKNCILCEKCLESCSQNAITISDTGPVIDREKCVDCFECVSVCHSKCLTISGTKMTVKQLVKEIKKSKPFFDKSGGGVVLSGGEFTFREFDTKMKLLQSLKDEGIGIGIDTSGYAPREKFERLIPYTNYFLWDIKQTNSERHRELTGVPLDLIIENLKYVSERGVDIYLRCPMIPGMTDDEKHLHALSKLAIEIPTLKSVDLLPIHHLGKARYEKIGKPYPISDVETYSAELLERKYQIVKKYGLPVAIIG